MERSARGLQIATYALTTLAMCATAWTVTYSAAPVASTLVLSSLFAFLGVRRNLGFPTTVISQLLALVINLTVWWAVRKMQG